MHPPHKAALLLRSDRVATSQCISWRCTPGLSKPHTGQPQSNSAHDGQQDHVVADQLQLPKFDIRASQHKPVATTQNNNALPPTQSPWHKPHLASRLIQRTRDAKPSQQPARGSQTEALRNAGDSKSRTGSNPKNLPPMQCHQCFAPIAPSASTCVAHRAI